MKGLEAYERSEESLSGVEVILPRGVKANVKEFGTAEFWQAYADRLTILGVTLEEASQEHDRDATAHALATACLNEVAGIKDKSQLFDILMDPKYWELRRDLVLECKKTSSFLVQREEEGKKFLVAT